MRKIIFEFFPIIIFFIAYKASNIFTATSIALIVEIVRIVHNIVLCHTLTKVRIFNFFLVLVLGTTTIYFHNPVFIKWKVTILYWLFGITFISSAILRKKYIIREVIKKEINLPIKDWRNIDISWGVFFILLGILNLIVAYHCSTDSWVKFKLFGTPGIITIFILVQISFVAIFTSKKREE